MRKIILIGKMNETVKDLNTFLSQYFHVQICSENPQSIFGMLEVVGPEVVLISLIGALDIDPVIFNRLAKDYKDLPVLTIGTEGEQRHFLEFYQGDQFENLIRPLENSEVRDAIARRLGMSEKDLAEEKEAHDAATSDKKRVLIVDDNAATLRSIKGMLDSTYDIIAATSGIKAMTAIGKKRPDLILLDYEMPVCDGRQTLEMIRADEDLQDIPVIFLTGVSDREHIEAVLALKPLGYMLKPPVQGKLLEAIGNAIGV